MSAKGFGTSARNSRPHHDGFTLLEVMIVVGILSIGAAIAIPNYQNWLAKSQLRQAAGEISTYLNFSKAAAMSRNRTVTAALALSAGELRLTATDAAGVIFDQRLKVSRVTGVTVVGGGNVAFNSQGLRASGIFGSSQLITISNDTGLTYSVRVSQSGNSAWCPQSTCV
jgi:type IV pilus assembly protein PilA